MKDMKSKVWDREYQGQIFNTVKCSCGRLYSEDHNIKCIFIDDCGNYICKKCRVYNFYYNDFLCKKCNDEFKKKTGVFKKLIWLLKYFILTNMVKVFYSSKYVCFQVTTAPCLRTVRRDLENRIRWLAMDQTSMVTFLCLFN